MGSPLYKLPVVSGIQLDKFGQITNMGRNQPCPPGFTSHASGCYESTALAKRFESYYENKAHGFVDTLKEVGPYFAAGIATALSFGAAAPTLSAVSALKAAASVGLKTLSISGTVAQLIPSKPAVAGGQDMGLNLGNILGAVGSIFGGSSSVPVLQTVGQIANAFAPAFAQPVYSPPPAYPQPQAQPVMSTMPVIAAGGRAIVAITAPILFKVASKIGKRVSLQGAISMIRKMGKFLMDPAAIAVALGITVGELATLITAHSSRKSRSMNAANPKALRRAARRIKSFHRMCGTIDLLKSRGKRSRSVSSFCGTCRKRPCRC